MYRPIHDLHLSATSQAAIDQIKRDIGLAQIGMWLISVGHVHSLILGNSGHASRTISISTSDWEDYQSASDWNGAAKAWLKTVDAIIRRKARFTALEFPDGQEKEFWLSIAGDRCNV